MESSQLRLVTQRFGALIAAAFCGAANAEPAPLAAFSTMADGPLAGAWKVQGLPLKPETPLTEFSISTVQGRHVLTVRADKSYANAVHAWPDAKEPIRSLAWSWKLEKPLAKSNLKAKSGEDTALKLCVLFDMPTDALSGSERLFLSWGSKAAGQKLPSASLCYVWDTLLPAGTVVQSPFTKRVVWIVVDSGAPTGQFVPHQVDVAVDFARHFGHESAKLPPVLAIAIGADADNTQGASLGHVTDVLLKP